LNCNFVLIKKMAAFYIKDEPVELEEPNYFDDGNKPKTRLEMQIESEEYYLTNLDQEVLNGEGDFSDLNELMHIGGLNFISPANKQLPNSKSGHFISEDDRFFNNSGSPPDSHTRSKIIDPRQEKLALEKKQILAALNEQLKLEKNFLAKINNYKTLSASDENKLLENLNRFFDNCKNRSEEIISEKVLTDLMRFRAKLEMRSLKRKKSLKVFNLDAYVNELIDREKHNMMNAIKKWHGPSPKKQFSASFLTDDDDIIFEGSTLKTSESEANNGCEIIELVRVLDRFNDKKFKFSQFNEPFSDNKVRHNLFAPIGMVESRNEDVKCLISPYSKKFVMFYFDFSYESIQVVFILL
jgi:hypothetical protein